MGSFFVFGESFNEREARDHTLCGKNRSMSLAERPQVTERVIAQGFLKKILDLHHAH